MYTLIAIYDIINNIYKKLVIKSSKWNDGDVEDYLHLFNILKPELINISEFGFKLNAIFAAKNAYENNVKLNPDYKFSIIMSSFKNSQFEVGKV